jgi:hypothetical protein
MTNVEAHAAQGQRKSPALLYLLLFVFVLFIGILVMVYFVTKHSNPVMLDEHGKPGPSTLFVPEVQSRDRNQA